MKTFKSLVLISSLTLFTSTAIAQEKGSLNVKTVVQKEEVSLNAAGERETVLVEADTVTPGDSVIYTITFKNVGDESADNVVITNPVPENLTYIDGSAFGPGATIEFSIDGGENFATAGELRVPEDGGTRAARAEDYTHLRWIMQNELAAGSQGVASFRARLN